MSNVRPINRDMDFLMPPSVDEWLPQRHLARFVVEVIEGLDLRSMTGRYRGSGEASYPPHQLLGLIIDGYAMGVFSSGKLERAHYDWITFCFIAANQHPDHATIANFRRRFLPQIEALFMQVLDVTREMGVLKLDTVALDGTKIHANASRHSVRSDEHATKIETPLKAEVADLLGKAEAAHQAAKQTDVPGGVSRTQADVPDGMQVPEELAWRDKRLAEIARAKAVIEARAKERHARERAEYEAKLATREAKQTQTDRKPRGREPQPPVDGRLTIDQVNLTDEESRIMPVPGGGFEQCYNAQAAKRLSRGTQASTNAGWWRWTACRWRPPMWCRHRTTSSSSKPMLEKITGLAGELGAVNMLLFDNGYCSESNLNASAVQGIEPVIAMGREAHHPSPGDRVAEDPPGPEDPTPLEAMRHLLQTKEGRKRYVLRKQTPEPVFGIIKSVLGFRRFLLLGLDKVRGEWSLVTVAWNLKRMFALVGAN